MTRKDRIEKERVDNFLKIAKTQNSLLKEIQKNIPEGFSVVRIEKGWNDNMNHSFRLDPGDKTLTIFIASGTVDVDIIHFAINVPKEKRDVYRKFHVVGQAVNADGHTNFYDPTLGHERTFDLRGVDDSFSIGQYSLDEDTPTIKSILEEQIKKVHEYRERSKNMIDVPVIGFRMDKNVVEQTRKKFQMKSLQSESFMPGGFGTGYVITNKPTRFSHIGDNELAQFFGVERVWVQELECD